jgi:hypothetical protein
VARSALDRRDCVEDIHSSRISLVGRRAKIIGEWLQTEARFLA